MTNIDHEIPWEVHWLKEITITITRRGCEKSDIIKKHWGYPNNVPLYLDDLECNLRKTDVKSWSGKIVLIAPSRMTITSLLLRLGNWERIMVIKTLLMMKLMILLKTPFTWSISKSMANPALLVSLPWTERFETRLGCPFVCLFVWN